MNSKVFFIHVPKTAGLTVYSMFFEILGPDEIIKLGVYDRDKFMSMADFRALPPERIAAGAVITGHFSWGSQNRSLGAREVGMTLRDPCTRVLSYLDYQHRAGGNRQISDSRLRTDPECNNGMVRRLRGLGEFDDGWWDFLRERPAEKLAALEPVDFDLACANLAAADRVLLTEKFVEGCVLWRHRLGMPPLVSIQDQFSNHAPRATDSANWPPDFVAEVRERNAWDIELYKRARARADADLDAAGPDLRNEIVATRCLTAALTRRGRPVISVPDGVDLILPTIDRLLAEGRAEIAVRVGYLLAERVRQLADFWPRVRELCREVCPGLEGEIDSARRRAEAWAEAHPWE
jgi:hypothetical protein